MAKVTVIPPKEAEPEHLRVAAYCRVSSNSADQLHSYVVQIHSYTELIRKHEGWELVDVYADSGLTGTRMDQRDEFNRMMSDCRKGRIDKILVKSISRFARNTRDCLVALRELFKLGVSVKFEEENIDTGELTSELMVSVSGSLAQQESISISQNQHISYQRRMEKGEFITNKAPFGYRLCNGKDLEIIPEEAQFIQWIFQAYLSGHSVGWIASQMTHNGMPTRDGTPYWQASSIQYILKNEKYLGCTLCQKTFTNNFPFKKKRNNGEMDQYYVESTHPAIISQDIYDKVQALMQWRAAREVRPHDEYLLSQRMRCKVCGSIFIRRANAKGYVSWVCQKHDRKASNCPVGRIPEQEIYTAFVRMYNKLKLHGGIILQPALNQLDELTVAMNRSNPAMLEINKSIAQITEQCYNIAKLQSSGLIDAEACAAKVNALNIKLAELRAKRRRIVKNDDISEQVEKINYTADIIANGPDRLETLDTELFASLIEQIIAESQTRIRFRLYGGIELAESVKGAGR